MAKESLLDRLRLAFRCPMEWKDLQGEERDRFCDACQRPVHDLSARSRQEAELFLRERPGECVRMVKRPDGSIVTAGCPHERRRLAVFGAAAAGTVALVSCASEVVEVAQEPGPRGSEERSDRCVQLLGVPMIAPDASEKSHEPHPERSEKQQF